MPVLTELERRVLGHLPAWAEDEEAHVEMEGGPRREEDGAMAGSIRAYAIDEFTVRLAEDPCAVGVDATGAVRHLRAPEVAGQLEALVERGLAERDDLEVDEGQLLARWRMTQAGFEAITGPEKKPDQIPGPVEVETHPGKATAAAKGE